MPLDQFKTQILLLHSEQSTLDSISSGFGDSYTVHCATSGSEALNTLMDTPINVIVTAQDLPGMSGLEALREAKKRSPETIGILLAGDAGDDLEALVGDKEVFQVVRGNVTNDTLLALVDNATQQVRLTTLAESANDTAANVDEPQEEHIVMETADNGTPIITDVTGKLRALSYTTAIGSRAVDLLVLTKDQEFLATIKDSSREMHTVHYATTLAQAIETIRENKVGVAVVDAAMVGERVEQLTQHLRKASARLVSVVAGRRDDGEMLMDLINRGKVYRFLLKPVSPGRARLAIEASVKYHLEAPDAAFKTKGEAAVTSTPPPKPAPGAAAKPEAAKKPQPPSPPPPKAPAPSAPAASVVPPLGSAVDSEKDSADAESPVREGLADAFGESNSNFSETVSGLMSSVGQKLSADKTPDNSQPETPDYSQADMSRRKADVTPATSGSGGSLFPKPMLLGVGGILLAAIAGATFLFMNGSDDNTVRATSAREQAPLNTAPVEVPAAVVETPAGEEFGGDADALIAAAHQARDAGQIFEPAGDNAIELYAAAVAAEPGNTLVAAELDAVIQQALMQVESALLESRLDEANIAMQRVGSVDPDNARLPFLMAQLSQMQLREHLVAARAAIRESRYEDAESAIAFARLLETADDSEIDVVVDELTTARDVQRAEDVLAMANARLEDNDLISPPDDNARYFYELALSIDPENSAASQGLSVVASKLALQARSEIDNGNLESAEELIDEALTIDATNSEIAAAVGALSSKRDAIAAQRQRDEAQRRAAAEQRAADARAAEIKAAELQAAEAEAAETQAAAELQAEQPAAEQDAQPESVPSANQKAASAEEDTNASSVAKADETPDSVDGAGNKPVVEKLQAPQAAPTTTSNTPPAAVSSLKRIKYVAPKYPRAAQRRNVSGWVDVIFTVTTDGTVKNVGIRESEPGETFVNAATRAVEKWEFEPVISNGTAIEQRVAVRMMFAVE